MSLLGLRSIKSCPLCGGSEADLYPDAQPNLYSEKLSGLLKIAESLLLEKVGNVQCRACGLIYKRRWFSPDTLRALFSDCVPIHPKGWDVVSGRFSAKNFENEVHDYRRAFEREDGPGIARFRRSLKSIIDSIPESRDKAHLDGMRAAIEAGDIDKLLGQLGWLADRINEPVPYTRFAGFSSPDLWRYLEKHAGAIRSYGEVGCPLWGLLAHSAASEATTAFVSREEPNYWGPACRSGGLGCLNSLLQDSGVGNLQWNGDWSETLDVLGIFQYLDHLESPDDFVAEASERADSLAIILDGVDQPPAVQHFTGWPETAIHTLAHRHGFHVHADFNAIRVSGNHLYLLARKRASAAA